MQTVPKDAAFEQMKTDAELLVRQIKDLAYDDAVLALLMKILDVRRLVHEEVMTDVKRSLDAQFEPRSDAPKGESA